MGPRVISVAHDFASWYIPFVYLPAIVLLVRIAVYSRKRYPDLFRRIWVGLGMGSIATIALDAVRQAGVIHGWLPADPRTAFPRLRGPQLAGSFPGGTTRDVMNLG